MKGFSGIADVDLKILSELDDESLFRACSVNKELFRICNKEPIFWKDRFIKKYGKHASEYKPNNRSWKNHYMQVFIYLQQYKKEPIKFLDNIIWRGNVKNSYYLDRTIEKLIPLLDAPENIQTNLWLLDLGNSILGDSISPVEFLSKIPLENHQTIAGFKKDPTKPGTYYPIYARWELFEIFVK